MKKPDFRIRFFVLFWLILAFAQPVSAQRKPQEKTFRLAGLFSNHMVLQQQTDAAIWGRAKANQKVTIQPSWMEESVTTTVDADGKWKTTVPTPEAGGPFQIHFESGDETQVLKNVMSGEVWICSGQSNMQWRMKGFGVDHFKEAVVKAKQPNIRYSLIPQVIALEPQEDVKTSWSICSPKTVLNFSATAYFFANKLDQELDGIPIGLISTNWGGSPAEAWINQQSLLEHCPEFAPVYEEYAGMIEETGVTYQGRKRPKKVKHGLPSVLYNSMIHPIAPFTCRGVIWYQGESNVEDPEQYQRMFPELIQSWRAEWGQGDFPFYYVQIAPFRYLDKKLPVALLRESQFKTLEVPNTGMVVTMDIGNPTNIHPKQKQPVGERLALLALAKEYGRSDLVYSGPQYVSHEVEGNQIRLQFEYVEDGIASRDDKPLSHFTIAGADQVFHPAVAEIDGQTIVVQSNKVANPVAVRFAWGNADEPNLMNTAGLPSSSFRTDDWPYAKPAKK